VRHCTPPIFASLYHESAEIARGWSVYASNQAEGLYPPEDFYGLLTLPRKKTIAEAIVFFSCDTLSKSIRITNFFEIDPCFEANG
jgi:hypothetical protein